MNTAQEKLIKLPLIPSPSLPVWTLSSLDGGGSGKLYSHINKAAFLSFL